MLHEGCFFPCQICGQPFNNYAKRERHLQSHLNSYKRGEVEAEKKKVPRERKRAKEESSPVEFDSSAEEDENIHKRRKDTKKQSRTVKYDSSAEEDENIHKGRKVTKKKSLGVNLDSLVSSRMQEDNNACEKRGDRQEASQSNGGVILSAEEKVCQSVGKGVENVNPSKADLRKSKEVARVTPSLGRKRKKNCENRSPDSSGVSRKWKKCPEASPLKADLNSKSCLTTKDPNVAASNPGDEGKPSERVEASCAEGKVERDQDTGTSTVVDDLKPSRTIPVPEDTLILYVNSPGCESIDSFSSLRPESLSESTLYIDIDNLPQCDEIDIRNLSASDLCPVEVEYLSGEDANRLAGADDSDFCLTEPIRIELDSGKSLGSVDEIPRKKAPSKRKSSGTRRKSLKHLDSEMKVVVKNLFVSNDDDFVLPEFTIDEDDR